MGASGQLGKEQALPCAENLFSRCGVRLGEYDGTPHGGTCPSSVELPEFLQRQECGTTETVSEAPGHINCLELWAVHLALWQFRPLLLGKHVLVRTDNTAAVSYINRLGGIRSHCMSQLARHLLLWSHTQFKSLRSVHIPGKLNRAAAALSRQLTFPGEWRLHPETIRLIWSRFEEAQVDLFASPESSHCQLYFSLTEGPLGTDAPAHSWPRACQPADLSGLPPAVVETITQARAPSTRQTYALKRSLFVNWCSSCREDPRRCTVGVVLSFLQEMLLRPTTMQWTAGPWESMISS